jgi:AraC-like DNA-binding protein
LSDLSAAATCLSLVSTRQYRLREVPVRSDALITVLRGEKRIHTADGVKVFRSGDAVAMARGALLDIENSPDLSGLYLAQILNFSDASLTQYTQTRRLHKDEAMPKPVASFKPLLLNGLLQECLAHSIKAFEQGAAYPETLREHRVQEVLLALGQQGVVFTPNTQMTWAERVRRLVGHRLADPWRSAQVAKAFHLSSASLQRRLANEGLSLGACVRQARLEAALGLLQTSARPVYEVAELCGYRSASRFGAAFRQHFGLLPSQLR